MSEKTQKNFFAIIMGFNTYKDRERLNQLRFAEKDATDLFHVLIDPEIGNYPRENITLITDALPQEDIETELFKMVVKERQEGDLILVYYSGHGFIAGDYTNAYLATPNVSVTEILNNPNAGLRMSYLHNDLFLKTKASQVIFILDCCHSGAFITVAEKDVADNENNLIEKKFYSMEGRVALVSSPRGVSSRESPDLQNGIFTSWLLRGLRGEAIEDFSSDRSVTIGSLMSYVMAKTPASQRPLFFGHTGRIVLTQPKKFQPDSKLRFPIPPTMKSQFSADHKAASIEALSNPFDSHKEIIEELLENLNKSDTNCPVNERILDAIQKTVNCDITSVIQISEDNYVILKFSNIKPTDNKWSDEFSKGILTEILPLLAEPKLDVLLEYRYGFVKEIKSKVNFPFAPKVNKLVAIPLHLEYPREFLVLASSNNDIIKKGDVVGRVVLSLFQSSMELTQINIPRIKSALLDDMKRNYGWLPSDIYNEKLIDFTNYLNTIKFAFEPIINLGKYNPQIDSWEALARNPETNNAPFDLFETAKLWGTRFIRILDIYCLRNAVNTYVELWKDERGNTKKDQLSVNVFPKSLFHSDYKEEIRRIIKQEDLLKPKELVLEISEQESIPKPPKDSQYKDEISFFEDKLHEYTDEFGIAFAIDDFGIGHSSVSRLVKLELDHIKIDRDILFIRSPLTTISYVLKTVHEIHKHHTNVVIEGFDGNGLVTLADLFDNGIEYVQGHLIRRAGFTLKDLDKQTLDLITEALSKSTKKNSVDNMI